MKLVRTIPLALVSLLAAACSEDRGDVTPTSGASNASASVQGSGGSGGGGGLPTSTGSLSGGGEGGATSTAETSTASAGGDGGAGGQGGSGGAGGEGGSGAGGSGGAGGQGGGPEATCANLQIDDGETDVDCGGPLCAPCQADQACLTATDCVDLVCTDLVCVASSCSDGVINGGESDVDCGGLTCTPCEVDEECGVGSDCITGVCDASGECAAAACNDDVLNGEETDVDCGGGCPVPCGSFAACLVDSDCASGVCDDDELECQPATCSDGVENGGETDIDCGGGGGGNCPDCGAGKICEVDADCLSNVCPDGGGLCQCPLGMRTVPIPAGGSYCIDPTEVTYAEYDAFITSNPPYGNPVCAFNVGGYTPALLWPPSAAATDPNYLQRPVRHVDWCDAAAYCAWRGKRLCGSIEGGPADLDELTQSGQDQWFNACTAGGTNTYPYSGAFADDVCSESVGVARTVPVAVRNQQSPFAVVPSCQGGYSNIHQMSGNLAEWVDACDGSTGAADGCVVRGGDYASATEAELTCAATEITPRNTRAADIGIRCCQ